MTASAPINSASTALSLFSGCGGFCEGIELAGFEIKAAVELVFKVEVEKVATINVEGKTKRAGKSMGKRKDWKKAYVSLKPGQEINFAAGE